MIPIGLFAAWVSSANHFKNILKRKQQIHREAAKKRKRDIKAAAKASKPPRKLTDGEIGNNGLECVSRNVLGVPVNGWVKPDERASFLCQERKRIELEYARNPDSSDSEDTLSN